MPTDIYESQVAANGRLAGIFECDDDTGYFYLYDKTTSGPKVLNSIHVVSGPPDFTQSDIALRWDAADKRVGLFIRGVLWAVFELTNNVKYGGNYHPNREPVIPPEARFAS